jgi:diguanylate cyclase (GGDEF)-like protein
MHEAIERALEHLRSRGEPSAVLLIDVEHPAGTGEHVLAALAERLAATLEREDLVARFGGDVLVAVVRDVADEAAAYEVATRLQVTLERAPHDGACPHISIGCSLVREQDASVDAVVARADAAMYAARNKASRDARPGGDCSPESERSELVEAAFERSSIEDFDVYYQPIVDLACGSVAAVEAILRWEHADLGTIAPSEFLPIAERHGQIVTLGRSVIEKACAQTVRWGPTRDGRPMRTCVNISPAQIADPAFVDDVQTALSHSGATARQLAFELTEETIAAAPPGVLQALADVRIELIFDHAGTAVPSQQHVAGGPIAMIKLDRSFVTSGDDGEGRAAALAQAAKLARSLRLPAVAKGVETLDQLALVRGHELPFAQGYLFSRPQSAPMVERLVLAERPYASLLAPRPAWLGLPHTGDAAVEAGGSSAIPARDEPVVVVGAPDVP